VARVIALDAGPFGMAGHGPGNPKASDLRVWMFTAWANGAVIVVPEIVDYEVRRSLILAELWESIGRLDALYVHPARYLPITTSAMRRAAELWARVRREHRPTAGDRSVDGDAIVAAQALEFCGVADELLVATDNVNHLSRYVGDRARSWRDIVP
jgi:predicted nucleic acid-binding protein